MSQIDGVTKLSRRDFLISSAVVAGSLLIHGEWTSEAAA